MANSRVARGRRSNKAVAEHFQKNGVLDAEPTYGSEPGRDVKKVPLMAVEVKARRDFAPLAWLKQAKKNAGDDMPVAIMRCDGQGEESVGDWLAFVRFDDLIKLAREAGYW